jgi:hypothetical protein
MAQAHHTTKYSKVRVPRSKDRGRTPNRGVDKMRVTFLGGLSVQTWTALYLWEKLFNEYEVERFIEIGCGFGNTSVFFLLQAVNRGFDYAGWDSNRRRFKKAYVNNPIKQLLDLQHKITNANVFEPENTISIMKEIEKPGRTILFCDGGDKIHEFRTFAPRLKENDIVAVHDWGRAITMDHIKETVTDNCFRPLLVEEHVQLKTETAMFIKDPVTYKNNYQYEKW